jgi:hypothetical protein
MPEKYRAKSRGFTCKVINATTERATSLLEFVSFSVNVMFGICMIRAIPFTSG